MGIRFAAFTFDNYLNLPARWTAFQNTLLLAPLGTLICLLVGYPLAFEPLGNREQVSIWSGLFALFALPCAALAWQAVTATPAAPPPESGSAAAAPPQRSDYLLWLALSATGSVLLLAITNHITQNVASIPLLWLAPLTLYLLTFIVAFEGKGLYRPERAWSGASVPLPPRPVSIKWPSDSR